MENHKIIGLCFCITVLSIIILFKYKSDNYYLIKFEIENINKQIDIYNYKINIKKEEVIKILKNIQNENYNYEKNLSILKKNSYSKKEIIEFIYINSVKSNINIIKISNNMIKSTYKNYNLYDISIELVGNLKDISKFILNLSKSKKIIDFSSFSLFITSDKSIINFSYIGDLNENK